MSWRILFGRNLYANVTFEKWKKEAAAPACGYIDEKFFGIVETTMSNHDGSDHERG
jgi:hypothetical protein